MKIKKDELKRALEIVKPGLATLEAIEQSTSFAFIGGNVVTYNNEISVSHPIKDLDITGAIKADELYKYLGKVKTDEIELEVTENELIIKSGRATSGFALNKEVTLPLDEELSEKGKWKKIPEKFLDFLKFTSMGCSTDMTNPKITCVHVNKNVLESTDNFRLTHCTLSEPVPVNTFLIPASSVSVIIKNKPTRISEGVGWVHFKTPEGTIISCRTFEGEFLDTSAFLKIKKGVSITIPDIMKEVIDRALVFAQRQQIIEETVDVTIKQKSIIVESKSETNWFKETIANKFDGTPFTISLTPSLLKDILGKTSSCTVVDNMLYFKEDDWFYLTMLKTRQE